MAATLKINFSHCFSGMIWNMLAVPQSELLIIEVRDGVQFKVSFSAFNFKSNLFIWKDWTLNEEWWIGLTAAKDNTLLFHTFTNRGNPDQKNLIACDLQQKQVRWEVEAFSFFDWDHKSITGYRTLGEHVPAIIDIDTGLVTEQVWKQEGVSKQDLITRPIQYVEGLKHFETIKEFVTKSVGISMVAGVDYLEWRNWIIISAYQQEEIGLANYLLVFTQEGDLVLREKLGEKLEGLGVDTFFILSGCLFFVKNRLELVAYTFYD